MKYMHIFYNEEIQSLIDSFAYCFKVRISFYSSEMEELSFSYQAGICPYCRLMREELDYRSRCIQQDSIMCASSENNTEPLVYQCYAGLTDTVIPVRIENIIVGYAMLGQFRQSKKIPDDILHAWKNKYPRSTKLKKAFFGQPYYEKLEIENMVKLFDKLCKYIFSSEMNKNRNPSITENVIQWIDNNISQMIKLDNAAVDLGYSRSSISHTIKKNLKMSFKQLCILKKLRRFESLLQNNPAMSIKEAAYSVGYDDQLYFSRLYKKNRSASPSDFHKSIQKNPEITEALGI